MQYVAVVGVQQCEVVLDKFRSEMSESVWFEQQLFDLTVMGFLVENWVLPVVKLSGKPLSCG